ncbi:MAG TPA: peptide ABC transporter ATP-binding protein [Pseudomonas sp.]|nr:peptide ABC transporter ATP-binding protein [Pseudomonas sp.]HCA23342.1 peptide ABC transporter ATP-binding protein [Pseudomonas sp.]
MKYARLCAALLTLTLAPTALAQPYRVVTEEWAPYNFQQDGEIVGIATEIVRAIMTRTGDNFELELLPSMRAGLELRQRPHTVMFSMFRTTERESLFKWVGPLLNEAIYPYQRADAKPVNSLEQLYAAPRITTRHAGLVPASLEGMGFGNLDKSATSTRQLYQMLLAGRTDIIVGDTDTGVAHYSAQLGIAPGTLRRIPIQLLHAPLYIAFSLDSEDQVVDAWSDALEQLRGEGELQRILDRYQPVAQAPTPTD